MNPIRYSIGNTRAQNTMPLSIGMGTPQVHASGKLAALVGWGLLLAGFRNRLVLS